MSTGTKSCRTTSANMSSANPRQDLHRNAAIRGVILRAFDLSRAKPRDEDARRTSAGSTCNHVCLNGVISGSMRAPARPANSPCQTVISLVHYSPYESLAASLPLRRFPFLVGQTPRVALFLCNLTPLESALVQVLILINLKLFRMNTYEKQGVGGTPRFGPLASGSGSLKPAS
jgi:hypothetical protein